MTWLDDAACKGMTTRFFVDAFTPLAKATCAGCEVRPACQQAGLREEFGTWGGLDPRERERVRNKRKPSAVERAA